MPANLKEAFALAAATRLKGILQHPEPSMARFEATNFVKIVAAAKTLGALPEKVKIFEAEDLKTIMTTIGAYQELGLHNDAREILWVAYQKLALPEDILAATLAAMTPRGAKRKAKR